MNITRNNEDISDEDLMNNIVYGMRRLTSKIFEGYEYYNIELVKRGDDNYLDMHISKDVCISSILDINLIRSYHEYNIEFVDVLSMEYLRHCYKYVTDNKILKFYMAYDKIAQIENKWLE